MEIKELILYDWLSFTAKHHSPTSLLEMLGLDISAFQSIAGVRGYENRLYFNGVNINYGGRDGVWCELSGQGCRTFETYGHSDWHNLFEEILSCKDYNLTRLDVAYDDHDGILDLDVLWRETLAGNFVSKFKKYQYIGGSDGITIYHGSMHSAVMFRIYDKAKERGREEDGHWVRFEMMLRDKNAARFINFLLLSTIGEVFTDVVNNYLRYVTPNEDTNNRRWPTADYWTKFINTTGKISLYEKPGVEYNFSNLERFVVNQAGAAVAAYCEIVGDEKFLDLCKRKLVQSNNPKYDNLIHHWKDEIKRIRNINIDSLVTCLNRGETNTYKKSTSDAPNGAQAI